MARVTIDDELLRRLERHTFDIGRTRSGLIADLVRDYLDETGVWAEVSVHLATIKRMGRELEAHAQAARRLVDELPRFARTYSKAGEE